MGNAEQGQDFTNLEQMIDQIVSASRSKGQVLVDDIMNMVGRRSFGPLLLMAGLLTLAPIIGDIPGTPTVIGIFVFLLALQLLLGRDYFWLPHRLRPEICLVRSVAQCTRSSPDSFALCSVAHQRSAPAMVQKRFSNSRRTQIMNSIIWIVGAVVIVVFILGLLGLR
ncbi:exopolysaccharide biosynthesis protein [Haliea sp.]